MKRGGQNDNGESIFIDEAYCSHQLSWGIQRILGKGIIAVLGGIPMLKILTIIGLILFILYTIQVIVTIICIRRMYIKDEREDINP